MTATKPCQFQSNSSAKNWGQGDISAIYHVARQSTNS